MFYLVWIFVILSIIKNLSQSPPSWSMTTSDVEQLILVGDIRGHMTSRIWHLIYFPKKNVIEHENKKDRLSH